jgi:hypothetical protein
MTTTTFLKTFTVFILLIQGFVSVAQGQKQKPINMLVLLDLSDRVLNRNQAEEDIKLIQTAYAHWMQAVKQSLFISAQHRFRIVVLPQTSTPPVVYDYENKLYLNLAETPTAQKRKQCEDFQTQLPDVLAKLYRAANTGSKPENYAGVDIWRYFNEQLASDLSHAYDNRILIFTDGYFDFENPKHAMRKGNRMTYSGYLAALRGKTDWKEQAVQKDYGMMKIDKKIPAASLLICGIQPKYQNLQELDMLLFFWEKWAKDCGLSFQGIARAALPKMEMQVKGFLK